MECIKDIVIPTLPSEPCNGKNHNKMKNIKINVKNVLAIFVVVFCLSAIVFIELKDIVLGALIGFIGAILQFFFGSSTGSVAKDKTIQDLADKTEKL